MTTLETSRLVLRPFTTGDVDFVFDLYSRWEVARWLGPDPRAMTERAQAERAVARWGSAAHPVHGTWAVQSRESGLVGVVLLQRIPVSEGEVDDGDLEVGWQLHPDAWGHGYATEAAARVIRHAFAAGIHRIVAVTYPDNVASRRVAERVGMTYLGPSRRYYDTTADLFEVTAG